MGIVITKFNMSIRIQTVYGQSFGSPRSTVEIPSKSEQHNSDLDIDSGEDDFSSSKVQIRILLAVDRELFPMTKTLPWKILLRPKSAENACSTYPTSPTPFYNSSLRMESSVTSYLRLLHTTSTQCESFKEACMLWTVWLRQRGFGSDLRRGGFGSFESHLVLALLLAGGGPKGKPLLSPSYNHYQLFKGSLQFLASKDLMKETLIMHHEIDEGFRRFLPTTPLFFDGERGLNVLYKMPPWSYIRVRCLPFSMIRSN